MRQPIKKQEEPHSYVWLDGKRVEPTETRVQKLSAPQDYYNLDVDGHKVEVWIDYESSLLIQAKDYKNVQVRPGGRSEASLTITNSQVALGRFTGVITLTNAAVENCNLQDVIIHNDDPCRFEEYKLVRGHIENSTLVNVKSSPHARIEDSVISNSTLRFKQSRLSRATIRDSILITPGELILNYSTFNGAVLTVSGDLIVAHCNLCGVHVVAESMKLMGHFSFFTLTLPKTTLHFYQTDKGKYELSADAALRYSLNVDGHWSVKPDDKEFEKKVHEFLLYLGQELPDEITKYVVDSVNSRIKVLEMLYIETHREFVEELSDPQQF